MNYRIQNLNRFKRLLDTSQTVLILQPERLDPDSIGSALALSQVLTDKKKTVINYALRTIPRAFSHFPNHHLFTNRLPQNFDITILVDCGGPAQLQQTFKLHQPVFAARPFVIIDHHANREPMPFKTLDLIDHTAASAGQQVAELGSKFGWQFTPDSAYGLAASIKADTLDLSTSEVTPRTLRVMAKLVEGGADLEKLRINIEQAEGLSTNQLALKTKVLNRTTFHYGNKIAISYLNKTEFASLGPDSTLDEQVKQELRSLKGILVSAVISERQPGAFKISMRSNLPVVGPEAAKLGGGGHDKAASFFMDAKSVKPVITKTAKVLEQAIRKYEAV